MERDFLTGDRVVDGALAQLDSLEDAPVREHVEAVDAVAEALANRLAETGE